jgi:hypothetical protein
MVTMLASTSLFTRQQIPELLSEKPKYDGANSKQRNRSHTDKNDKAMSTTSTETVSRPLTPSSPVVIPRHGNRDAAQNQRPKARVVRHQTERKQLQASQSERRVRAIQSPDALPPTVAALVALTAIPPPRSNISFRKRVGAGQRLDIASILKDTGVTEKELSLSLGESPLDLLLSPPHEVEDDDTLGSEAGPESVVSTRNLSSEVMPSLGGSISSSPCYPSLATVGSRKRSLPMRRMQ